MPYAIKLLEEADKEFSEATAWYEEQSAGLGTRFINVIQSKLNLIAQHRKGIQNVNTAFVKLV